MASDEPHFMITNDKGEDFDVTAALTRMHDKLDKILENCCTHSRRVASTKPGDPIFCEDCHTRVGTVQ